HGRGAHAGAGLLLPPGTVFVQEAGRMRVQLCAQELALVGTDGGSATGMAFGRKRAGLLLLLYVAFDGGEADAEAAGDFSFGASGVDGGNDLGAEVRGICFHPRVCQTVQSLRKLL